MEVHVATVSRTVLPVEEILQRGQVVAIGVRDGTETQSAVFPGNPLIAVHRACILLHVLGHIGPQKNTDEMLAAAVYQSGDCASLENVEPAADERKILRAKIRNGRRESDFSVKPRLDGMQVCRSDVGQVAGLERANVRVHKLRGGCIRRRSRRLSTSAVFVLEFPGSASDKQKYGSKPA